MIARVRRIQNTGSEELARRGSLTAPIDEAARPAPIGRTWQAVEKVGWVSDPTLFFWRFGRDGVPTYRFFNGLSDELRADDVRVLDAQAGEAAYRDLCQLL